MSRKVLGRVIRGKSLKKSKRSSKYSNCNRKKRLRKKLRGYIPFETLIKLLQQSNKKQDVLHVKSLAINEKKSRKRQKETKQKSNKEWKSSKKPKDEFVPLRELLRRINKKKKWAGSKRSEQEAKDKEKRGFPSCSCCS
ncbi:MAG: hypothetical protein AB1668_03205 [Nanoarchaeota archaeon]